MEKKIAVGDIVAPINTRDFDSFFYDNLLRVVAIDGITATVEHEDNTNPDRRRKIVVNYLTVMRSGRTEGEEILPVNMKNGDKIMVSREHMDILHTRTGIVGDVQFFDYSGRRTNVYIIRDIHGSRLNWGKDFVEKYTLVEAAPEVDEVLEKLKAAPVNSLIRFGKSDFAEKVPTLSDFGAWNVFSRVAGASVTTVGLREIIGDESIQFLRVV